MIGEVAVVRQGDVAPRISRSNRLNVIEVVAAGGRIADVPDRGPTRQFPDGPGGEDVADESFTLEHVRAVVVEGDYAGRLLTPVLERVHRQECLLGRQVDATDAHNAAFVSWPVVEAVEPIIIGGDYWEFPGKVWHGQAPEVAGASMIAGIAPKKTSAIAVLGQLIDP